MSTPHPSPPPCSGSSSSSSSSSSLPPPPPRTRLAHADGVLLSPSSFTRRFIRNNEPVILTRLCTVHHARTHAHTHTHTRTHAQAHAAVLRHFDLLLFIPAPQLSHHHHTTH